MEDRERKVWGLLVVEDAPDRDPRGKCTTQWVQHTEMFSTRASAEAECRRLALNLRRLVRLVEIPEGDMFYPPEGPRFNLLAPRHAKVLAVMRLSDWGADAELARRYLEGLDIDFLLEHEWRREDVLSEEQEACVSLVEGEHDA